MTTALLQLAKSQPDELLAELRRETVRRAYMAEYDGVPWAQWLVSMYPDHYVSPAGGVHFSDFHRDLWKWVFGIDAERPQPFIGVVFRFGGKSTNCEAAVTYLGAERLRNYCLYVCSTQSQADDHVQSIAEMMASPQIAERYPQMAERKVNQFNQSMGWRINRLRTASGFTVDAVGLDKAMRGAKLGHQRPDIIVFDDIDETHDSPKTVEKKIETLTRKLLPAGAANVAVMGVQNLIHGNSIFAKMVDGDVDFLSDRKMSGPYPALRDFAFETDVTGKTTITQGKPTWSGMTLDKCQEIVDDIGLRAFRVECQHETEQAHGAFLVGVWESSRHIIEPFQIPAEWFIDRSYDWGFSAPWACIYWAESDGETPAVVNGIERTYPKGTLFAIGERYGWSGKPNEGDRLDSEAQALAINADLSRAPWGARCQPGPADDMIFKATDGASISSRMIAAANLHWTVAVKGPGSREAGANDIVARLNASAIQPMDRPGLFIWNTCPNIIRTWPLLPADATKPDDVDTDAEEHLWDAARYRCLTRRNEVASMELRL